MSLFANAASIEGLDAFQPMSAPASAVVEKEILKIQLQDARVLKISPWPTYLPQRFSRQHIAAGRQLHPAGPTDSIEFRRKESAQPWLRVITGTRISHNVVGDWTLDRIDGAWTLRNGAIVQALKAGGKGARVVRVNGERWCVFLMDADNAVRKDASVAHEQEPQVSLALVRVKTGKCSTQH